MKYTKKITYASIEIELMKREHVSSCIALWVSQFDEANDTLEYLPLQWRDDTSLLQTYLEGRIDKKQGIVAYSHGEMVGFMAYDRFMFHGEETAISPIIGHASVPESKVIIYREMYRYLAGVWVADGALNHIITSYSSDEKFVEALFHLGFGVYVIDAFRGNNQIPDPDKVPIRKAELKDLAEVKRLAKEFKEYMLQSPVFLVTRNQKDEYYTTLLNDEKGTVFVTEENGGLTGFLYVRENDEAEVFSLAAKGIGVIDMLGAYVEEPARGSGAALSLLNAAITWCIEHDIHIIHVDYESANLLGSGFWSKYFTPALYSLKRRANQDIMD
ncbi:MAG: GNAT family N-acetyltransferase [Candidatus Bathyarchaeota archaeon]|nr:GNAT family N-acetyltransferase [Candidatus Bathyarchaeota archaeon]